jgi:hypothetical protein
MTRIGLTVLAFFGAVVWAAPAMAQTTVTLKQGSNGYTGTMDTYIDKISPYDIDFYGGVERIEIRSWNGGVDEKMNVLIKFDLSTLNLPANATITGAKLTLYSIRARGQNGDVPVIEKVTSAWNNQSTWSMGVPSAVATGITCPPVTAAYTDDPVTPEAYAIPGLQTLVQDWLTTPALNYGVMLSVTTDLNFRFASSENPNAAAHPELEITYTTPAPANPPTVTATPPSSPASSSPVTVTGTAGATSPATVAQVTWKNNLSGVTGTATGTTSWTATIPLVNGNNSITITVTDSTGATATTSFNVGYFPPRVAGKGDKTYCGMGVTGGSPASLAVAALALVLLVAAASRRTA